MPPVSPRGSHESMLIIIDGPVTEHAFATLIATEIVQQALHDAALVALVLSDPTGRLIETPKWR